MSYVLTLVASRPDKPVTESHIEDVTKSLRRADIVPTCAPVWLQPERAVDLGITEQPEHHVIMRIRDDLNGDKIDVLSTALKARRKKLLMADMDSTIVQGETLDDLAECAGIKDRISAITAKAMNGELDFRAALRERVKLLQGLEEIALEKTLRATKFSPGAEAMVKTMARHECKCILISGGFTVFTQYAGKRMGFHANHGNTLEIANGQLTGKVLEPILDKYAKVDFLKHYIHELRIKPEQCMAIGDGANDIPMLQMAGLGIGYKPKPAVAQEVYNVIKHGDLTAALFAQGYSRAHFIKGL